MDRVIRKYESFESADDADLDEWLALSGDERLRIGEEMRQEAFGIVQPGLQRALRVAEREAR